MIHSMSGGTIAGNAVSTYAKVETEEGNFWYLATQRVNAGDAVLVPAGGGRLCRGRVLRTEDCTPQTAPVPARRAREIAEVLRGE